MIRENWRIVLLVVLLVASSVALFAPAGGGGSTDSPTNLQYGIELSGGTTVRAPLTGYTAKPVDLQDRSPSEVQRTVATELNVSLATVRVRPPSREGLNEGAVEVYTENVTQEAFAAALGEANVDATTDDIRQGVTEPTRQETIRVLNDKINEGGLTGGRAVIGGEGAQKFVIVEVPNANRSEVLDLIGEQGRVQVVALHPNANNTGYERTPLFDQSDLDVGGTIPPQRRSGPAVSVRITNGETAQRFSQVMLDEGFTDNLGQCSRDYYRLGEGPQQSGAYCLLTVTDGKVVYAASMGDLATTIENGEFVNNPTFVIGAQNQSAARDLEVNLRAGALPTTLDTNSGTIFYLQPSLAQEFKLLSLVTALIAVLAVAGIVFLRYREVGVALPMVITATAEVYLLLGFAALVGLALDLSHIAGFIAVIGTGVDDLIIIADEILQGERVETGRVFSSRFRKAFWVIGAAAVTTIIAMSPLALLSLGDLQGFAIVTIVGVLLGVLVTRPAYGNILRNIVLD